MAKTLTRDQRTAITSAAKKVRLHFHPPTRCGTSHDSSCGSRKEVFCASVKIGPIRFCSCGHA